MTQKPNELLRYARQERGWSQQRVAEQIGTNEDVISRWERGERSVSPFYQEKLCLLFGKNARELGFIKETPVSPKIDRGRAATKSTDHSLSVTKGSSPLLKIEAFNSCFSFGKLETTWQTLDGDGEGLYLPQHIRSHYIPFANDC
jgi:transcriptional regulator with XRE-family HTH domain